MDNLHPGKENADPTTDTSVGTDRRSSLSGSEYGPSRDSKQANAKAKSNPPTVDDFELLKPISRGAFGKVFLGHKKTDPSKLYAVKVMKKADLINKNLIAQVTTERDALAMTHSPFIVQLFYSLQSKQNIYLVMEYLVGGDVKSMLAVYGFLGEDVSCFYTAEVTLALEHLHSHGIIHRDLKPDNMLISAQGHIKLTDFGLSKFSLDVGTPNALNQLTPRSQLDKYRTPGQILSLKSSLMFSVPKPSQEQATLVRSSKTRKSILGSCRRKSDSKSTDAPMSPLVNGILLTPDTHGSRVRSLHQRLTSHSMISPRSPMTAEVHSHTSTPPVKSLTPTLQESLQYSRGTPTADERREAFASLKRQSSTMCGKDSITCQRNASLQSCSMSSTDEVFSSTRHDFRDLSSIAHTPGDKECGDLSCLSHDKASSRQESLTDDTPQLHRTSESVWNSYAARNLRSFREGSYSDISLSEDKDRQYSGTCYHEHGHKLTAVAEAPVETSSSISQHSSASDKTDDEKKCEEAERSDLMLQPCRKRIYEELTMDNLGYAGTAHTGLTQEVRVMVLTEEEIARRKSSATSADRDDTQNVSVGDQHEVSMECDHDDIDRGTSAHCKIRITSTVPSDDEDQETSSLPQPGLSLLDCLAPVYRMRDSHLRPFLPEAYSSLLASSPETEPEDESANSSQVGRGRSGEHQEPFKIHLPNLELKREKSPTENESPEVLQSVADSSPENEITSCMKVEGNGLKDASVANVADDRERMGPPHTPCIKPSHKPPRHVEFKEQPKPRQVVRIQQMSVSDSRGTAPCSTEHDGAMEVSMVDCKTPERPANRVAFHDSETPKSTKHPLRTPKEGVRRGPEPTTEKERILGTPDYLAPEILLQGKHGPGVDWWALGVCLFEFLTGLPPFNDETPERVFSNILDRAISWPRDMMGDEAQEAVNALLTMDPRKRPGAAEVKAMPFFSHLDWNRLLETEAPFIPAPDDNMDTSYFEPKNSMQHLQISAVDM